MRQATASFSRRKLASNAVEGAPFKPGDLIAKRYRVKDVVGQGPLGFVFRAHDDEVDVEVALKAIQPRLLQTVDERKQFSKWIRQGRKLTSPLLARVYEDGEELDWPFFTAQFVDGLSLRKIIDLRVGKGQYFSLKEAEPIFQQLANALEEAHKVGPHSDFKPENVIVLPDLLKVTDFSLGLAMPRLPFMQAMKPVRADRYLAPELGQGPELDLRADIFSLGVILGEMLSGRTPDDGEIPELHQVNPDIPPAVEGLYRKAVNANPLARFASAAEFGEELAAAMNRAPPPLKRTNSAESQSAALPLVRRYTEELPPPMPTSEPVSDPSTDSTQPMDPISTVPLRPPRTPPRGPAELPPPPPARAARKVTQTAAPPKRGREWMGWLLLTIAGLATGSAGYWAYQNYWQKDPSLPRVVVPTPPPAVDAGVRPPAVAEVLRPPDRLEDAPDAPDASLIPDVLPVGEIPPPEVKASAVAPPTPPKRLPDPTPEPPRRPPARAERPAPAASSKPGDDCAEGMRLIPAGRFRMGTARDDPMMGFDERILTTVELPAFCIDLYEYPNRKGAAPTVAVSWNDAKRLCESKGKRLCSEPEWEKACKGPGSTRFPYGNAFDAQVCNTENASGDDRSLASSGRFSRCRSGYGVYDLSGNVAEWTSSSYAGNADKAQKGGSFDRPDYAARCSARKNGAPDSRAREVGFRCCADPAR